MTVLLRFAVLAVTEQGDMAPVAITNYNDYIKHLERIYRGCGHAVSDSFLRGFIAQERLDKNFGINADDVRADLTAIHHKATGQKSAAQTSQVGLKTYTEYMEALEKLYISKGKTLLTDGEIQHFIFVNKLDRAFGITITDVKMDLFKIDRKWHPPTAKPQPTSRHMPAQPKSKLTTYKQYTDALERLYIQNGKALTDAQLIRFISENAIGACFGVTLSDVKKDLQNIEKKHKAPKVSMITDYESYERELTAFITKMGDQAFLDHSIKAFLTSHGMAAESPALISDVRMDLVFAQSKMPLVSATAKRLRQQESKPAVSGPREPDRQFQTDVAAIILKHRESFHRMPAVKGLLWDYFPDRKREINVLMLLANQGMLEAMRLERMLDSIFISKYVSRIVSEYGIEKSFATEMALVWCHGYGEAILGKKLIL